MHLYTHEDRLNAVDANIELNKKIAFIHQSLKTQFPFVARIAAALHDPKSDLLKTFIHSSGGDSPLPHYQAKLAETPSLLEILAQGRPRVVNDLSIFDHSRHEHALKVHEQGYHSSYTMPMYQHGILFGFLFFNSYEADAFTEDMLQQLDPYGHLIIMTIINDLSFAQNLLASIKTARDIAHVRDDETATHQDRMSRFARLIAQKIADQHGFSDEYIEHVFEFASLHDIGKIGVPDKILLKNGKLTDDEFHEMQSHTVKGRKMIDQLLANFDLNNMPFIDMLKNIAEFHHEAMDGSGYHGRKGEEIPIEARIVAVADVFDALTSSRPYKQAWSNDEAFAMLQRLSGSKLDPECVQALVAYRTEVEDIQHQFRENSLG